jgi:4-hydroxybenzoate polyprenyltransferase
MRPKQWTKNVLLFAGLIFTSNLTDPRRMGMALLAFAIFCALSGVIYLINDIKDADSDRLHPKKKNRPIASGRLSPRNALIFAAFLTVGAFAASLLLDREFTAWAFIYWVLLLAYSLHLKHVVILDLLIVAMGFVIRGVAGVKAVEMPGETLPITPWFITCVLFLALFIVICKRRHELSLLEKGASDHRPVLEHYSLPFLDQMVSVATAATVLSYALYVTKKDTALAGASATIAHPDWMIWTLPFVVYGVFRYLYLVYRMDEGGAPESVLTGDKALMVNVALWVISMVVIFYVK